MSRIERVASNTPWEPIFGYVRKVKAGNWLVISGTTATDDRGMIVGAGQMYVQARQALSNLKHHIESAGFSLADVIRTRVFVTDMSRFAEVARAHKEVFGDHPPASTLVEVTRLVHPDMMIEIEVDAVRIANAGVEGGGEMPSSSATETRQVKASKPAVKSAKPAMKSSTRTRPKPKISQPRGKR